MSHDERDQRGPGASLVRVLRERVVRPVLDPEDPRVLAALTRLDELRRPPLRVLRRIEPLEPTRRQRAAVVVPLYNYGEYVGEAVRSAVAQQGVDVQVVVVDDASTDDSYEVACALAAELEGVVVLRNETNAGPGVTFNRGWQAVDSDFVVRLDPDDLLPPGALARVAAVLEAAPEVGLVYGRVRHFQGAPPAPRAGRPYAEVWPGAEWVRRELWDDRNLIATPEAAVRTSLMREHGGWKPQLRHTQDHEMWLRAASVSDVAYVHDADQALKRVHPDSLTVVERDQGIVDLEQRRDSYESWFADVGHRLPDAEELRALQRRAMARRALETAMHRHRRGLGADPVTEALERFAEQTDPQAGASLELRLLRAATRRLGAGTRYLPTSVLGAAAYRLRETAILGRLRATGH